MKIGFYSPYLDTYGGGERYILTLASHLSKNNTVDIFWGDSAIKAPLARFLKIDLTKANFVENILKSTAYQKIIKSRNYDLIFVLSDGSIPLSFGSKNILHFQVPFKFTKPSLISKLKLSKYQYIVANSQFTKKFIDKSFGVNSTVIYPPVDIYSIKPLKKEKYIISVGRFSSHQLHPKKQEILIEVFKELYKKHRDWKLILAGQAKKEDQKYIRKLKKISRGFAVQIKENVSFDTLKKLYGKSSIYWHATGFGEDEEKNPERMEHFGISTVEASAAGAVPIVIAKGGQKEIIQDNKNGRLWNSKTQLLERTAELIENKPIWDQLCKNAIKNSRRFSKEKFIQAYEQIIF